MLEKKSEGKEKGPSINLKLNTSLILMSILRKFSVEQIFSSEYEKTEILTDLASEDLNFGKIQEFIDKEDTRVEKIILDLSDEDKKLTKKILFEELKKYVNGDYESKKSYLLKELSDNQLINERKKEVENLFIEFVSFLDSEESKSSIEIKKLLTSTIDKPKNREDQIPEEILDRLIYLDEEVHKYGLLCSDVCLNEILQNRMSDDEYAISAGPLSAMASRIRKEEIYNFFKNLIKSKKF